MCGGKSPAPPPTPAAAPPPAAEAPVAPVVNETGGANEQSNAATKSKGRSSLRIDLASANPADSGTGLNIPV